MKNYSLGKNVKYDKKDIYKYNKVICNKVNQLRWLIVLNLAFWTNKQKFNMPHKMIASRRVHIAYSNKNGSSSHTNIKSTHTNIS